MERAGEVMTNFKLVPDGAVSIRLSADLGDYKVEAWNGDTGWIWGIKEYDRRPCTALRAHGHAKTLGEAKKRIKEALEKELRNQKVGTT